MTINEAKMAIASEFIGKYREFLVDLETLDAKEQGRKYGYSFNIECKDTQKTMLSFQKYVFSGRWLPAWVKAGFDKKMIWELHRIGFLAHDSSSNWQDRQLGHTDFYYINQAKAKEIYRAYKNGFFDK